MPQQPQRLLPLYSFRAAVLCALSAFSWHAQADEGLWPLHSVPVQQVKAATGVELTPQWLQRMQLAAGRYGSSAAFVSASGLMLTNHHVVEGCLYRLMATYPNIYRDGYLATTPAQELRCPGADVSVLISTQDLTQVINQAAFNSKDPVQARRQAIVQAQDQCKKDTGLVCEVVTLYRGAEHWMYRYKKLDDVRLVWAPENAIGSFGGDLDNFVYPRYNLDAALVRAYDKGQPYKPQEYLRVAKQGVQEGDAVFAIGNPRTTERGLTAAETAFEANDNLPRRLASTVKEIKALAEFSARSPENAKAAQSNLFGSQNWYKSTSGAHKRLQEPWVMQAKQQREQRVRQAAAIHGGTVDPWRDIAAAVAQERALLPQTLGMEGGWRTLMSTAFEIVDIAYERERPATQRLDGFNDEQIGRMVQRLGAQAPYNAGLETLRLQLVLERAQEALGVTTSSTSTHPYLQQALNGMSAAARAQDLVSKSQLHVQAERQALLQGGVSGVMQSKDAIILLARATYEMRRDVRVKQQEAQAAKQRGYDQLVQLERTANLPNLYPDATNSMRLSYGRVRGYDRDGVWTAHATTLHGLYERAAVMQASRGQDKTPFTLPQRWVQARNGLVLETPLNFVNDLDIFGGSSGSPVVNAAGELVGLQFDGNVEQTGNRFAYEGSKARAIAVDVRAIVHALDKVYGAKALVEEFGR